MAHQNYGEGVYEHPPHVFVNLILNAYIRENAIDLWKFDLLKSALEKREPLLFDDWIAAVGKQQKEQSDIDPTELLERMKKDLGKG